MSNIVERLTEGIVNRDMRAEGSALLNKWEKTGLLEGLTGEKSRNAMARLLENQAKELLRESSTMSGGDVEGFAAVAFPIVRRVFAGLIANDLVSVQPMSLPSGLIFFLDFTVSSNGPGVPRLGYGNPQGDEESLYGQGRVGKGIVDGVLLGGVNAEEGPYNLNNGYASPTGSGMTSTFAYITSSVYSSSAGDIPKLCEYDAELESQSGTATVAIGRILLSTLTDFDAALGNRNLSAIVLSGAAGNAGMGKLASSGSATQYGVQLKRLTRITGSASTHAIVVIASYDGSTSALQLQQLLTSSCHDPGAGVSVSTNISASWPITDDFIAGGALGSVIGDDPWGLENNEKIPEIDIKVDSIAVTAVTKKLKAKWTPELGQDLNAYHNLDAEVELTSILSEQIALEIDREILEDLIRGSTASTYYWSRSPGLFVNRTTGVEVGASTKAPDFTGTVSEWYETLVETINDVSAQIHRKTLRGGANFIVCGPEVANILEFTAGFRASVTHDDERGSIGAVKVGSLTKKFDVYVDPYFLRNVILVGRRGSSFLESGYVYAPYVPLQTTPTIFGPEDFVPRKGVMTRYAKKMVRPDMYGLVVVRGLLGESGATS
jgi:hypothetical protein